MLELHEAAGGEQLLTELLDAHLQELFSFEPRPGGAMRAAEYPHLAAYGVEPGRVAFLLRVGSQVAGFALVRRVEQAAQAAWRGVTCAA